MWMLIAAVVTASLLGSTHCVGMCGPLAMWASGLGDSASRGYILRNNMLYHFGRMLTYAIAGGIAGGLGSLVEIGGDALGIQLLAARVVGTVMILVGLYRLSTFFQLDASTTAPPKPSRVSAMVAKARPYVYRLSPASRAITAGLLTTLLPCGWLYLFALVAAGTGSVSAGAIVMVAFWVGTVPALTALVAGSMMLSRRLVKSVPVAAAILLIVAGGYTAAGRGFAQLNSLSDIRGDVAEMDSEPLPACCQQSEELSTDLNPSVESLLANQIESLTETPLPCCAESKSEPE